MHALHQGIMFGQIVRLRGFTEQLIDHIAVDNSLQAVLPRLQHILRVLDIVRPLLWPFLFGKAAQGRSCRVLDESTDRRRQRLSYAQYTLVETLAQLRLAQLIDDVGDAHFPEFGGHISQTWEREDEFGYEGLQDGGGGFVLVVLEGRAVFVDGARLLEVFDFAVCFEVGEYVEEGGGLRWVEGGVCHGVFIVDRVYAWDCFRNRTGCKGDGKTNATWCLLAALAVMTRR